MRIYKEGQQNPGMGSEEFPVTPASAPPVAADTQPPEGDNTEGDGTEPPEGDGL